MSISRITESSGVLGVADREHWCPLLLPSVSWGEGSEVSVTQHKASLQVLWANSAQAVGHPCQTFQALAFVSGWIISALMILASA
jgi:hypothetical protein